VTIRGVLFDMDGLMIDSEPLWQRAEIEVFATVGIRLTRELCLETRGRRIDEVVEHWRTRHPWPTPSAATIRDQIVGRVIEGIRREGTAKPGLDHAIEFFASLGLPLGVASSSDYAIIDAVLECLGVASRFAIVHSGEEEALGKPHPDVYRSAALKLGVAAEHCLALEDSPSGVAAARAAGMRCIAVLDATGVSGADLDRERTLLADADADAILTSLEEIDARLWHSLRD
jgi:sugar-phosphatase